MANQRQHRIKKYKRIKGGEKNEKSGKDWTRLELEDVVQLYIELEGRNIHENNPRIHELSEKLGRTVRSVENQLLGYKKIDTGQVGREKYNSLLPEIWQEYKLEAQKYKQGRLLELEKSKENEGSEFRFRVSSQLKNIIGRDLITDDYIAIFELVKNSYDAYAKHVKIIFEQDKIIIWDDGKGMDKGDIIDKWLFVAYSAKKEGVEDEDLESSVLKSYRSKIRPRTFYAGAKGIGRFSTDRLGSKLKLITRKPIAGNNFQQLFFNWDVFEVEATEKIDDIVIEHEEISKTQYPSFNHGVILEITELNSTWPRGKLLNLKWSLEKLINPFEDIDKKDNKDLFNIEIICEQEKLTDKEIKKERDRVNGRVKNFVFETLNIKTTQIISSIENNGEDIITTLIDRGELIYKIKEPNTFSYITNTKIQLFYLNTVAKNNFTRLMGLQPIQFGNVFLFNNGFRIYPFGEDYHDPFGIDRRKQQGYARYIGSRELIGSVELWEANDQFKETSSRDGGLVDTPGTKQLEIFFIESLRKLENFVSPILWKIKDRSGNQNEIIDHTARTQVLELVTKLTEAKNVELLEYNKDFVNIIDDKLDETTPEIFDQLAKLAEATGDKKFEKEIDLSRKEYEKLLNQKQEEEKRRLEAEEKAKEEEEKRKEQERLRREAEEKAKEEEERRKEEEYLRLKAEEEAREERAKRVAEEQRRRQRESQVRFLESVQSLDIEDVLNFNHQIGIDANTIDQHIVNLKRKIDKDQSVSSEEVKSFLDKISFALKKILAVIRFTNKENFLAAARITKDDIILFYKNYILNILKHHFGKEINITIDDEINQPFIMEFKPIELSIIIDNLLTNSRKKNAKKVNINFSLDSDKSLKILYRDFGDGLDKTIENPNNIFEKGYTTTRGSGLGLFHVRKILEEMNGSIKVNTNVKPGIEFTINLRK